MEENFQQFLADITLTSTQQNDAQTKYTGVCKCLYRSYYGDETYDASKQFLFGSYKTKTNIRPLDEWQDVDVLFKIPQATFDRFDGYSSNGQSALLQEVRNILKDTYTTTDEIKAWGKVVLVVFSENHHNVELLPALEQEDGTFLIPNTENGGSWEVFDPRAEIDAFNKSNQVTDGLTRDLAKMLKKWARNTPSMTYKSFQRMNDIIAFLDENSPNGKGNTDFAHTITEFFDYMLARCYDDKRSYLQSAHTRAAKALEYEDNDKPKEASEEWRKIFGEMFPAVKENPKRENQAAVLTTQTRPWFDSQKMK